MLERWSGWGESTVGSGLPAVMDLGSGGGISSTGVGSGSGAGAGVADRWGGVIVLLFAACSARAAARAGSFLFLSIAAASRSGCATRARVRHIFIGVNGCAGRRAFHEKREAGVARREWWAWRDDSAFEVPVCCEVTVANASKLGKNGWTPKENGPCSSDALRSPAMRETPLIGRRSLSS
jgi:hypothetical protein